jgi:phage-related protein
MALIGSVHLAASRRRLVVVYAFIKTTQKTPRRTGPGRAKEAGLI